MNVRPQDIEDGRIVSHYRILHRLPGGNMGVVYKAEDIRLKGTVALKFISPEMTRDEDAKRRFIRTAQAEFAIDHPNICTIHDIDETPDGELFISMSFYDGESLDRKVERGPMPVAEALDIAAQIADGLACAHGHGVIHRDIKPANIMVTPGGTVKILDFGLAKLRGNGNCTSVDTTPTRPGTIMGTCAYMSPEQASGGPVDGRADIFSLGIVLYEMLAGRRPFDGAHAMAVMYQIVNTTPKPISAWRPGLDPALQRIVDTCLQKNPAARYATAAELRDDLRRILNGMKPLIARIPHHYLRMGAISTLVVGLVALLWLRPWTPDPPPGQTGDTMHVAVLPFENVGKDPHNQAFCDGMMETLACQLSQLEPSRPGMWITPASVVRAEKVLNPDDARRLLGVNLVVTGAVQRIADRVRVTLSLVDVAEAARPRQVRSAMIDNAAWKAAALQDEVVMRVADMMTMSVAPEEERVLFAGGTPVSAAYDFYLQGVGYVRAYEVEGNLDRAISAFSMALDRDSTYALAHAGLGEAYWRAYKDRGDVGLIEQAREHARRAVTLDSLVAPAHVTLGLVLAGTGSAGDAIAEFRHAIALDPGSEDAVRGLATAYAEAKQPTEAEATYRRAITMKPDYWGGYHDLGMFFYRQGEYAKAAAQFQEVARLNPGNKFAWNNMGGCYWALDDLEKAREMFQRSIAVEPNHRAFSNLGSYYLMKQSWTEAARMCEQAVRLNPSEYRSYINLANAYYWIPGERARAMETYRAAVDLMEKQRAVTPENVGLLTSLEASYAVLGEKERAIALIRETLRLAPENERALYFAGHSYEQLGQRDQAVHYIEKAIDAGYPTAEITDDPWLHELRKDRRFEEMMLERAKSGEDGKR